MSRCRKIRPEIIPKLFSKSGELPNAYDVITMVRRYKDESDDGFFQNPWNIVIIDDINNEGVVKVDSTVLAGANIFWASDGEVEIPERPSIETAYMVFDANDADFDKDPRYGGLRDAVNQFCMQYDISNLEAVLLIDDNLGGRKHPLAQKLFEASINSDIDVLCSYSTAYRSVSNGSHVSCDELMFNVERAAYGNRLDNHLLSQQLTKFRAEYTAKYGEVNGNLKPEDYFFPQIINSQVGSELNDIIETYLCFDYKSAPMHKEQVIGNYISGRWLHDMNCMSLYERVQFLRRMKPIFGFRAKYGDFYMICVSIKSWLKQVKTEEHPLENLSGLRYKSYPHTHFVWDITDALKDNNHGKIVYEDLRGVMDNADAPFQLGRTISTANTVDYRDMFYGSRQSLDESTSVDDATDMTKVNESALDDFYGYIDPSRDDESTDNLLVDLFSRMTDMVEGDWAAEEKAQAGDPNSTSLTVLNGLSTHVDDGLEKSPLYLSIKNTVLVVDFSEHDKRKHLYCLYCPEPCSLNVAVNSDFFETQIMNINELDFNRIVSYGKQLALVKSENGTTIEEYRSLWAEKSAEFAPLALTPYMPYKDQLYIKLIPGAGSGLSYYDLKLRGSANIAPIVTTESRDEYKVTPLFREIPLSTLRHDSTARYVVNAFGTFHKTMEQSHGEVKIPVTFRVFTNRGLL